MRTMQLSLHALAAVSMLGALVVWAPTSSAETWPQRTVRVIVPLPPGTSTDLVARLFAEKLSARWRQPVVIENRQGVDGIPAVLTNWRRRASASGSSRNRPIIF
jgi:tripartite-type tricarboxylate transporter receptor subunit TctC